jgi:hypothetical protein
MYDGWIEGLERSLHIFRNGLMFGPDRFTWSSLQKCRLEDPSDGYRSYVHLICKIRENHTGRHVPRIGDERESSRGLSRQRKSRKTRMHAITISGATY